MQSSASADSEVEKRRMEEEMVRARLARMRAERTGKGGDFGMRMHGIDLDNLTESQSSMATSLKNNYDSKPAASAWKSPNSTSAAKAINERTPVSLAAFIGGQAGGPRLNKHAPQADASTMFDGRARDGAVHPIFGRGGIAMPGMVKQAPPAEASSTIRDEPPSRTAVASNNTLPGQQLPSASRSASSLAQRYLSNVQEQAWQPPSKAPINLVEDSQSDPPTASLDSLSLSQGSIPSSAAFPAPAAITRTTSAPSPSVAFPPFSSSPPVSPTVVSPPAAGSQDRGTSLTSRSSSFPDISPGSLLESIDVHANALSTEASDEQTLIQESIEPSPSETPNINIEPTTIPVPITYPIPLATSPQPQSSSASTSPSTAPNLGTNINLASPAPANTPTKSHSAPAGPSWKPPNSIPSSNSVADKTPTSLAAFMGGSASGPRLNKHTPQDDASVVYDGRAREGAVHPVFGQGGIGRGGRDGSVAMPGMVDQSRSQSEGSAASRGDTWTSSSAGMQPQRKKSSLADRYLQGIEEQARQQVSKPTPRDLGYDLGDAH